MAGILGYLGLYLRVFKLLALAYGCLTCRFYGFHLLKEHYEFSCKSARTHASCGCTRAA